jgi:hypothetical protein
MGSHEFEREVTRLGNRSWSENAEVARKFPLFRQALWERTSRKWRNAGSALKPDVRSVAVQSANMAAGARLIAIGDAVGLIGMKFGCGTILLGCQVNIRRGAQN